ncbi:MAG: hypothetical protein LC777_01410 [Actinobacteria bacterium]|nr:hypothetical protein [Actinomycetota bacterium]
MSTSAITRWLLARRDRLDALIGEQAVQGPWAPTVARLRCLRSIDTLTAVGLIAEIGDITAFVHPTTVAVAVARELTCFVWEIAQQPD